MAHVIAAIAIAVVVIISFSSLLVTSEALIVCASLLGLHGEFLKEVVKKCEVIERLSGKPSQKRMRSKIELSAVVFALGVRFGSVFFVDNDLLALEVDE